MRKSQTQNRTFHVLQGHEWASRTSLGSASPYCHVNPDSEAFAVAVVARCKVVLLLRHLSRMTISITVSASKVVPRPSWRLLSMMTVASTGPGTVLDKETSLKDSRLCQSKVSATLRFQQDSTVELHSREEAHPFNYAGNALNSKLYVHIL